jgi:hypothetical protein
LHITVPTMQRRRENAQWLECSGIVGTRRRKE